MANVYRSWYYWLFLFLLLLGIYFRFVNLDQKVYWHDEVYTSLRVSGYTGEQVLNQVFNGQVIQADELLKFQLLSPERDLKAVLYALANHPEHPPLYYLLARFWCQFFGCSVASIRSLSALISLLVFPCFYWLCWELFKSPVIGAIAVALVAVTPFHVLYAQEAREYSLWTVTILLSSASLLQALRVSRSSKGGKCYWAWLLYTITLTVNLYVSLLSIGVTGGQAIYVAVTEKFQLTQKTKFFVFSLSTGVFLFVPWIAVIISNFAQMQTKTGWTKESLPLESLFLFWQLHLSSIFVDFDSAINLVLVPKISWLLLALVGYGIYTLCRYTSRQVWSFVLTLIAVTATGLILPDLILGGQRSTISRYFIPCYIGIQIAVAYLLWRLLVFRSKIGQVTATILFTLGIISCLISSGSQTWWHKLASYHNPQVAAIINQAEYPLVIGENYQINLGNLISLSHLLDPQVNLLLLRSRSVDIVQSPIIDIPKNYSQIFLYNPSPTLLSELAQNQLQAELITASNFPLWQLKKAN